MNKATKTSQRPRGGSADEGWDTAASAGSERELATGLSARLVDRLRDVRLGEGSKQVPYLASLTNRAYQSARRWIDPASPGLPDLASFKSLCLGLDSDPGWLLGLVDDKRSLRESVGGAPAAPAPAGGGRGGAAGAGGGGWWVMVASGCWRWCARCGTRCTDAARAGCGVTRWSPTSATATPC